MGCDTPVPCPTTGSRRFQSTHPGGVRLYKNKALRIGTPHFNPRTRVGCDLQLTAQGKPIGISIHAPGWGATGGDEALGALLDDFNPRTRVGCDGWARRRFLSPRDFNPRTRVGCDSADRNSCRRRSISIHAPGWGATRRQAKLTTLIIRISIHAPGWGATPVSCQRPSERHNFNPRTRVGCDAIRSVSSAWRSIFQSTHPGGVRRRLRRKNDLRRKISIHAPGWGATRVALPRCCRAKFQSTHPGGVRRSSGSFGFCKCRFQSTHPGGVRQHRRMGIDWFTPISIHAPGWGATRTLMEIIGEKGISIHAPGWGATWDVRFIGDHLVISIHAPGWGAT